MRSCCCCCSRRLRIERERRWKKKKKKELDRNGRNLLFENAEKRPNKKENEGEKKIDVLAYERKNKETEPTSPFDN